MVKTKTLKKIKPGTTEGRGKSYDGGGENAFQYIFYIFTGGIETTTQ